MSLVTNPDVGTAVHGLVDTLFTDFLGSFGVVPAISGLLVRWRWRCSPDQAEGGGGCGGEGVEDQPGY